MRVPPLPKSWLIHSVVYEGYTGEEDDWGNPAFAPPVSIANVRVDKTTVFSRDSQQNRIVAEAVVFVDAVNSSSVPEFKEQSLITFEGKSYVIQRVIPCYYPQQNKIRHYELEVI